MRRKKLMKNKFLLLSIGLISILSACAVTSENTYKRTDYNDPIFANNYYKIKDEKIINNIGISNTFELDKNSNSVFTSYNELKELGSEFDKEVANDEVTYDSIAHFNGLTTYGTSKCLGSIDDSFNHGMLSKLTDGLLFCDGKTFQGVRVQIDQEGYVQSYEKTCLYADYFALSFKPASDYTNPLYNNNAFYDIRLKIKFYVEDGDKLKENIYTYELDDLQRDKYLLFGFALKKEMVQNLKGLGISYDLLNSNEDASIDNCLLLYETLFVNSIWY